MEAALDECWNQTDTTRKPRPAKGRVLKVDYLFI